ncbi:MAG: MarR family transcriptional regulator [Bacillaceae bacterium]|nr:MarR family transcriptional regulator [Bacillaceae bacterium]
MCKNQVEEVELSLHVMRVLARAYKSISEHSFRSSKEYGFKPNEFAVLELLYHKGPQPLKHISGQLLLVKGGVTYVVDKLEKKGYLIRELNREDRRIVLAKLTEKGRKTMANIFPGHAENLHRAFRGLTSDEKKQVIRLLKKMGKQASDLL